jgi:tartrate-resistant acid phosphatase type 5
MSVLRRLAAGLAAALPVLTVAPPPASAADQPPQRAVAVIGDFGSGTDAERRVADLVAHATPRAVVTTGDNVYDSADYDHLVGDFYGSFVSAEALVPAVGNHDHDEGIASFDRFFPYLDGRHVYASGRAGIRFFFLDSTVALESGSARERQRAWLQRSLARSQARWKVVVLHHPPYSSGTVHGSTADLQWPFAAWGADLVLSGHEHNYERISRGGVTYVVDGAGGKELYPLGDPIPGSRVRYDEEFGALFLEASTSSLVGEFWSAAGQRVDRFVLTR